MRRDADRQDGLNRQRRRPVRRRGGEASPLPERRLAAADDEAAARGVEHAARDERGFFHRMDSTPEIG